MVNSVHMHVEEDDI